jgi:hypothetical protein
MAREIRIKFPGESLTGTAGRGISSGEGALLMPELPENSTNKAGGLGRGNGGSWLHLPSSTRCHRSKSRP